MSSCEGCTNTHWHCLGCQSTISVADFAKEDVFDAQVAVFCNCCEHNFVCKTCYAAAPGYDTWKVSKEK